MSINRDECPRLVSLAVHELRTPVTVVAGYLRMLLTAPAPGLSESHRKFVEEAQKSCWRISTLLDELSELGKFDGGDIPLDTRDVSLFPLLAEAAASVRTGADRDIHLEPVLPGVDAVVRGDRKRLAQALTSVLEATLRERVESGVVVACGGVQARDDGRRAWIVVAPREDRVAAHPFDESDWDPFQLWRGGVGFRLVMAQEVIAAHGGCLFSGRGETARGRCALTLPV